MKLNSRKTIITISCSILGIIFISIFCLNFFHDHAGLKLSLMASCMYTIPLALISLPCGIGMMVTGDASRAYEDKNKDSEDRHIYENGICPFYSHKEE